MSGGSMDYFYSTMEEHCDDLKDKELVELAKDLAKIFHDREWFDSGDYGEGTWNKSVADFKRKWFETPREERLTRYIDQTVSDLKIELGIGHMCKDCACFHAAKDSLYSTCENSRWCSVHGYEKACEMFRRKEKPDDCELKEGEKNVND